MSDDYDAMTIPQLRSLAARHNVDVPDTVKRKADWVDLCNSKIPKTPKPQTPRSGKAKAAASPKAAPRTPKSPRPRAAQAASPAPASPAPPGTAGGLPWIGPSPKRDLPPKRNVPPLALAPPSPRPATPAAPSPAPSPRAPRALNPAAALGLSGRSVAKILLVGTVAVGVRWVMPVRRPFCGPEEVPDCIPCPAHGTCTDGALQCDDAYARSGHECIERRGARYAANQFAVLLSRELSQALGEKECGMDVETIWHEDRVNQLLDDFLQSSGDADARAKQQLIWKDLKNPQRLEERGLGATVANGFYSRTAVKSWGCWGRELVWDVWLIIWKPLLALAAVALAFFCLYDRVKWRRELYSAVTSIIREDTVVSPYLKGPTALEIAEAVKEKFPQRARKVNVDLVKTICAELVKKRGSNMNEDFDENRSYEKIYWYGTKEAREATPKRAAPQSPRLF